MSRGAGRSRPQPECSSRAWVVGWIVVAVSRRRDPRARILAARRRSRSCPRLWIAWEKGFAQRQFGPLAILSCIALGVAVVDALGLRVGARPRPAREVGGARGRVVVLAVALVPAVLTQDHDTPRDASESLDGQIAATVTADIEHPHVLTTFLYKAPLWVRLAAAPKSSGRCSRTPRIRRRSSPRCGSTGASGLYYSMPRVRVRRAIEGRRLPRADRTAPLRSGRTRRRGW